MPLSVASTTTARPPRNIPVRQAGHGRAGCWRATRSTPHKYSPPTMTTTPVTTGANCQTATTACQPNGRSMGTSSDREPTHLPRSQTPGPAASARREAQVRRPSCLQHAPRPDAGARSRRAGLRLKAAECQTRLRQLAHEFGGQQTEGPWCGSRPGVPVCAGPESSAAAGSLLTRGSGEVCLELGVSQVPGALRGRAQVVFGYGTAQAVESHQEGRPGAGLVG